MADVAAHYGSDDCPKLVYQFGALTSAARHAPWGLEQANTPKEVSAKVDRRRRHSCREDGCSGQVFKAGRCEPHYRANMRRLNADWRRRNPNQNRDYYLAHKTEQGEQPAMAGE